jgi:hypothetical protein
VPISEAQDAVFSVSFGDKGVSARPLFPTAYAGY